MGEVLSSEDGGEGGLGGEEGTGEVGGSRVGGVASAADASASSTATVSTTATLRIKSWNIRADNARANHEAIVAGIKERRNDWDIVALQEVPDAVATSILEYFAGGSTHVASRCGEECLIVKAELQPTFATFNDFAVSPRRSTVLKAGQLEKRPLLFAHLGALGVTASDVTRELKRTLQPNLNSRQPHYH